MTITIDAVDVSNVTLSAPNVAQLTTVSLDGTGVFDVLMKTTKLHLAEEYDTGRITGEEYSSLYLGALTAVMQQSVAYLLNHQNEEKILAEIGLLRQKTVTELAQTDDSLPVGLGFNGDTTIEGLVKNQKDISAQQILSAQQEVINATKNVELTEQKIITELAQTDTDIPVNRGLNNGNTITGLIEAQYSKTQAEKDLIKQKVITEVAQTDDTLPSGYAFNGTTDVEGLAKSAKDKTNSEVLLLKQKAVSELAQTADIIPAGTGISTVTSVDGVIGKQKDLFSKQTDGFDRDAEQKMAKIMVDSWVAAKAADSGVTVTGTNLDNPSIGQVVAKAKVGIGIV